MVPAAAVAGAQKNGTGFAGFASWLDLSPADRDPIFIQCCAAAVEALNL